jgi:hypothetical protein
MTSELTHLEKIDKAKKCFVWASTIDTNVRITKKEARALYIKYKNSCNLNYRWHFEYVQVFGEYWLYIN